MAKRNGKTLLECESDRTIHWIADLDGCNEKTQFIKYMYHWYKALPMDSGKKNDMMNLICN